MKKFVLLIAFIAVFAFAGTSAAQATPPADPSPPELCDILPFLPQCDGGTEIELVVEEPGENCPTGGVKLTLGEAVYYVCNGANGIDGLNGSDGSDGSDGTSGTDGLNGLNGTVTPLDEGLGDAGIPSCTFARNTKVTLPSRFAGVRKVYVKVDGRYQVSKVKNNRASVPTKGLGCGSYLVQFGKSGIRRGNRFWKLYVNEAGKSRTLRTVIGGGPGDRVNH